MANCRGFLEAGGAAAEVSLDANDNEEMRFAMDDHDERVRRRAYKIWLEEGRPGGRADAHWEMARELVAIEENFSTTLIPAPAEGAEARGGEPIEEAAVAANTGELPTIVDQGEQSYPPSRSNLEKSRRQGQAAGRPAAKAKRATRPSKTSA
jgi:hypothetical protein